VTSPRVIHIAGGNSEGVYDPFALELKERLEKLPGQTVQVINTAGSEDNAELVGSGDAELGIIQTDSSTPPGV